jgi:MoxR-like ATPase
MRQVESPNRVDLHPVVAKVRRIESELSKYLIKRDVEIRGAFIALASRQHAFYLGSPGSGKTYLATEICRRIRGEGVSFLIEFNAFILREEIFGPISLREMREHDSLARKYQGFLPSAIVAQLDELWKAPPALLNTLLRILNEREFRNDTEMVRSPLISAFITSNELPPSDRSLDALYDRILLRYEIEALREIEDRKEASTKRLAKRAFEAEITSIAEDLARARRANLIIKDNELRVQLRNRIAKGDDDKSQFYIGLFKEAQKEIEARHAAKPEAGTADGQALLTAEIRETREKFSYQRNQALANLRVEENKQYEREIEAKRVASVREGLPASVQHPDVWLIDNFGESFSDPVRIKQIADEATMPDLGTYDSPDVRELFKRTARWAVKHNYVANYLTFLEERDLDTLYKLVLTVTFPEEVEKAFYRILGSLPSNRSVRRETDLRLAIAAQAVLENRAEVAIEDLQIMTHALWDNNKDKPVVQDAVNREALELKREVEALENTIASWQHELEYEINIDYSELQSRRDQREHDLRRYRSVAKAYPDNKEIQAGLAAAEKLNYEYEAAFVGKDFGNNVDDDDPLGL